MTTRIGQLRYNEARNKDYTSNISIKKVDTAFELDSSSTVTSDPQQTPVDVRMSFADFKLQSNSAFDTSKDYYVRVDIPKSDSYDYSFYVKLTAGSTSDYQYIKNVSVTKSTDSSNLFDVGIVSSGDENQCPQTFIICDDATDEHYNQIRVNNTLVESKYVTLIDSQSEGYDTVVAPYFNNKYTAQLVENNIYYQQVGSKTTTRTYYRYYGKINDQYRFVPIDKFNTISLSASWKESVDENDKTTIDFLFRPAQSGFDEITFEMIRNIQDYGIVSNEVTVDGKTELKYGREVDVENVTFKVYELGNLVSASDGFSRIGVWGRPELMMGINGEQILIGPSGYYELEDLTITSLSIAAFEAKDAYTVDYTYSE